MIDEQKLYSMWFIYKQSHFWLTLLIGFLMQFLSIENLLFPLLNPVAISVLLVSLILIFLIFSMIVVC